VGHLDGDIPTADDDEAVRPLVKTKRLGTGEKRYLVGPVDRVGNQRPRPAREDDVLGSQCFATVAGVYFNGCV
jgi:hypothetical protein